MVFWVGKLKSADYDASHPFPLYAIGYDELVSLKLSINHIHSHWIQVLHLILVFPAEMLKYFLNCTYLFHYMIRVPFYVLPPLGSMVMRYLCIFAVRCNKSQINVMEKEVINLPEFMTRPCSSSKVSTKDFFKHKKYKMR